ncbi:Gfo/Idh/MocA family oxidoreductase [Halosimplex litoreum]|uniref:Gfo/Idh/MocA family oxidoreductase n=1 Tax=Halosimplex litoreum TaxID=1198301 RepID=A0A7T3FV59_9EURY|nr:Gfo/Idh/MocA family oxidoreductase [Halosimplex litoreum]QPV61271.1 Gfo/Idh/MocA family oxidoreductase [Halosimplex litoreum]
MTVDIGIVGAGNRGVAHADSYGEVDGANVVAVADIDEEAAAELAADHGAAVYGDFRDMLDDAGVDAVSVCVHNNLHRPVAEAAADAGAHIFTEKPMAATYTDAKAMAEAADAAGVHIGVQNYDLFDDETRAASRLVDGGELGEPYYARGVFSRRRGRPYIDGYGTPGFVSKDSAGGGPVIDIGTYVLGQLLYLLGNADVERVGGATFEKTEDAYAAEQVGENRDTYTGRLDESGYDVEDSGVGMAHLADGSVLELRAAWHMYLPDRPSVVAGSQGGLQLDPFEFYTTTGDYEATVSLDLDEYERRQGLIAGDGYETEDTGDQFAHWIDTIEGDVDGEPIPTGDLALNSMRIMEGIYLSQEAGRELTAEEIAERSESTAVEL